MGIAMRSSPLGLLFISKQQQERLEHVGMMCRASQKTGILTQKTVQHIGVEIQTEESQH